MKYMIFKNEIEKRERGGKKKEKGRREGRGGVGGGGGGGRKPATLGRLCLKFERGRLNILEEHNKGVGH